MLGSASLAREPIPVEDGTIEEFKRAAIDYGTRLKCVPLSRDEKGAIEANVAQTVERATRETGARRVLDQNASHFIEAAREIYSPSDRTDHLRTCPVCRSMARELLRDTDIDVVDLELEFDSVILVSPDGERFEFALDRDGELHLVDPETGERQPVPSGQLLRKGSQWFATDGTHTEGPVERKGQPGE